MACIPCYWILAKVNGIDALSSHWDSWEHCPSFGLPTVVSDTPIAVSVSVTYCEVDQSTGMYCVAPRAEDGIRVMLHLNGSAIATKYTLLGTATFDTFSVAQGYHTLQVELPDVVSGDPYICGTCGP